MILSEIEQALYDTLGYGTASAFPDTIVVRRIRANINRAYRLTITQKGIGTRTRRNLVSFSTVSGSPWAVLPQVATRIYNIADRTNRRPLVELSLQTMRLRDPGLTSTNGTPYGYVVYNYQSPTTADPSAAGQLTAVSDSATDTGATHTVYIEVVRTGGYQQLSSVALNGITPVSIGPATSVQVLKFYTGSLAAVGNIILKDAAANEIARIPIGSYRPVYTRLHIVDVPSAVVVLTADAELAIQNLANATDAPLLPEDYHDALIEYALHLEWEKKEDSGRAGRAYSRWKSRVSDIRNHLMAVTDAAGGSENVQFSQLGSYFESGT